MPHCMGLPEIRYGHLAEYIYTPLFGYYISVQEIRRVNNFLKRSWSDAAGMTMRQAVEEFCFTHQAPVTSPGAVHAWALVREYSNSPPSLLARLVRCHSEIPLRLLALCIVLDPELFNDPRDLAAPREFRRWLAMPNDASGRKQMDRALTAFREVQSAWINETLAYFQSGAHLHAEPAWSPGQVEALRSRKARPWPQLWSRGWYLAMSKHGLAWALAAMAVRKQPRETMRVPLLGFTKHITDKSDQGNCFADHEFRDLDAWTALALWSVRETWPDALSMLNPRSAEALIRIFPSYVDQGGSSGKWLPSFMTDQFLHLAYHDDGRPHPYGYVHLPWPSVSSVKPSKGRANTITISTISHVEFSVTLDGSLDVTDICDAARQRITGALTP